MFFWLFYYLIPRFVSNTFWTKILQSNHCGGVVSRNKPPSNTHILWLWRRWHDHLIKCSLSSAWLLRSPAWQCMLPAAAASGVGGVWLMAGEAGFQPRRFHGLQGSPGILLLSRQSVLLFDKVPAVFGGCAHHLTQK